MVTRKILDYNAIDWTAVFYYDVSSPSGLRRKQTSGGKLKDSVVGKMHYQKDGRPNAWVAKYQGILYQVHRIIWVILNVNIDNEKHINHIDNNPFNNVKENLELISQADNNRKCSQHTGLKNQKNNISGVNGVSYSSRHENGRAYFIASWRDKDGNHVHKYFSIKKLGYDTALSLAKEARDKAIKELISQGLGYSEKENK